VTRLLLVIIDFNLLVSYDKLKRAADSKTVICYF
jgi:hypothetical protein